MKFRVLNLDSKDRNEEVEVLPDAGSNAKGTEQDNAGQSNTRESAMVDSLRGAGRDATHGGVHVDGFLQPILGRKWWKVLKREPSLPKQAKKGRPKK